MFYVYQVVKTFLISQDVDSEEEYDTVHVITENEKVVGKLRLQFMNTLYSY